MIKAVFTPQNRMVYLELSFDVMSFMQQLRRASGKQDFQVEMTAYSTTFCHFLTAVSLDIRCV
jgi:hypothetical protein